MEDIELPKTTEEIVRNYKNLIYQNTLLRAKRAALRKALATMVPLNIIDLIEGGEVELGPDKEEENPTAEQLPLPGV